MKVSEWNVLKMIVFRGNMGGFLSVNRAESIYGKGLIADLDEKIRNLLGNESENPVVERKIAYLKENLHLFHVADFVQFIGISGSVAAGNAKEDDDIDLFIVVKNGTGWLYRGILLLKNLFNRKIRMGGGISVRRHEGLGGKFRDKFCVNLIVEQRGLKFEEDIFVFHELMHLVPVYNSSFLNTILAQNSWVTKFGTSSLNPVDESEMKNPNIIVQLMNSLAFALQLLYRILMLHKTNLKAILNTYKSEGKIIFYPTDFRKEVLNDFERKYTEKIGELFGAKDGLGQ